MQAIILADGHAGSRDALDAAWPGWLEADAMVIAADGGARHAAALGLRVDRWVGDGDSVDADILQELREGGVPVELAATDKDESDTELALRAAVHMGADPIVIIGALGGARVDHVLANVGLLAHPDLRGRHVVILDPEARVRLLSADPGAEGAASSSTRLAIPGPVGALVSLVPFGDGVTGVTTTGLRYPLHDEPLPAGPARGLSNVRTSPDAAVAIHGGRLLIVESPARLST
jgi:thiamine pyrophosphokinase